jgi:fucose permease
MPIVVAMLVLLVYGFVAALLGTILPDLMEQLHLTHRQGGIMASAQGCGFLLATLLAGILIDARGAKPTLTLGLLLMCAALVWLTRTRRFPGMVLSLFMLYMGSYIAVTTANVLASSVAGAHVVSVLNLVNLFIVPWSPDLVLFGQEFIRW